MLITLYKIGELHFRLLGTNGFHVKAKSAKSAASSRFCQNLKHENLTWSFGRLRQNIAPKSVPHVQHDYFSSFNQWNHWFVTLSLTLPLTLPSSNLKFPNVVTVAPFPKDHSQPCRMLITAIAVEGFGMAPYWLVSRPLIIVGFTKPLTTNSFCQHCSQSTATWGSKDVKATYAMECWCSRQMHRCWCRSLW